MILVPARRCSALLPANLARMSSTASSATYTMKPMPPKSHLHKPIPDSSFPRGYLLSGVHVGVKSSPSPNPNPKPDVAVVLSNSPRQTAAAACFTLNAFRAAPVVVSEEVVTSNGGKARAIVVNSGCANAVTGKKGMEDAWAMVKAGDNVLRSVTKTTGTNQNETLVMSTGVIGQNLPISKILSGISTAANSLGSTFSHYEAAARAFMTTDTFPKLRARTFTINGREYRFAGMDKGAGMIHPDMGPPKTELHATLLGLILTDACVSSKSLQSALTYAVSRSFNSISVDGDMSTNDTIIVMANGAALDSGSKTEEIDEHTDPEAYKVFRDELTTFAIDLAQLVVRDGEGATKFVTVNVEGASTYADAHTIASRISTSALVKTALYGEDANWGRILATSGSLRPPHLSTPLIPSRLSVSFIPTDGSAPLPLLTNGEPEKVDEVRAKEILEHEDLEVRVDVGIGNESATYWTCDFSYEYVRINGDYRS